jgi:hypothetical protein
MGGAAAEQGSGDKEDEGVGAHGNTGLEIARV